MTKPILWDIETLLENRLYISHELFDLFLIDFSNKINEIIRQLIKSKTKLTDSYSNLNSKIDHVTKTAKLILDSNIDDFLSEVSENFDKSKNFTDELEIVLDEYNELSRLQLLYDGAKVAVNKTKNHIRLLRKIIIPFLKGIWYLINLMIAVLFELFLSGQVQNEFQFAIPEYARILTVLVIAIVTSILLDPFLRKSENYISRKFYKRYGNKLKSIYLEISTIEEKIISW